MVLATAVEHLLAHMKLCDPAAQLAIDEAVILLTPPLHPC